MAHTLKPPAPQASSPSPTQVHGGHPPSPPQRAGPRGTPGARHHLVAPGVGPGGDPHQPLLHRRAVGDPAANRQGQEGKKTASGRGTSRKGLRSSQSYKAPQQQHGHRPRRTQTPAKTADPSASRSQNPASRPPPAVPRPAAGVPQTHSKRFFIFKPCILHARSNRPDLRRLQGGSDLPGGPHRRSGWC